MDLDTPLMLWHKPKIKFIKINSKSILCLTLYYLNTITNMSWGSSVSIVSDYRLDTRIKSLTEAKDFISSLFLQTSSAVHLASYPMDSGGPFPGEKCSQGMTKTVHHHPEPRSRMSRSHISSPNQRLYGV
jgi:hypothetical protein